MKIDDLGNVVEEETVLYKCIKDKTKKYRYLLERSWDTSKPTASLILHNPHQ